MKRILFVAIGVAIAAGPVLAQEPVTGAKDAETLFTSPDAKLHRNKQAAYHIQMCSFVDGKADEHWDGATKGLGF